VTSDAGGIPWIAEDTRTALMVPAGNTEALAAAMLATLVDPGDAAQRSSHAFDFVSERFAWTAVREQWMALYRNHSAAATQQVGASCVVGHDSGRGR
jgi:glycosyltransferase involved in cell wall biosynthesis